METQKNIQKDNTYMTVFSVCTDKVGSDTTPNIPLNPVERDLVQKSVEVKFFS